MTPSSPTSTAGASSSSASSAARSSTNSLPNCLFAARGEAFSPLGDEYVVGEDVGDVDQERGKRHVEQQYHDPVQEHEVAIVLPRRGPPGPLLLVAQRRHARDQQIEPDVVREQHPG